MNFNKYKLSEKFNEKKNEYEKIIEQNTKECFALNKKINDLISGKEIPDTNKEYDILNLKTKLLTLEVEINSNKRAIEELYIREMDSNLNKSRLNKEIDSTEFADQKRRLNSMKIFNGCKNDMKTLNLEDIIIDFKLRLEELKNSLKITTVEQKNINIKELEREKEITRQCYESSQEELINEKYDYDYKNIYYDRKVGKIDREEQQERIKNLENKEKVEPTDEEVEKMVDDFSGKYLEKEEIINDKNDALDYNKYDFSEEFYKKKNEYEKIIDQKEREIADIENRISKLMDNKEIHDNSKKEDISKLTIQIVKLETDKFEAMGSIAHLWIEEIRELKSKINKEKIEIQDKEVDDIDKKNIEKEKTSNKEKNVNNKNAYEKEISARTNFSVADMWKENLEQDIDKVHETSAYMDPGYVNEKHYKIRATVDDNRLDEKDNLEHFKKALGEEYSRGVEGDKKELFEEFAKLEVDGRYTDDPKLLLQFEKVKGLNIEEIEDVIGLDLSDIRKDIYIATYEKPSIDEKTGKEIMEPVKEYYVKDEKGEYSIIGNGDKEKTNITVDGINFNVKNENIIKGDKLEKVTQKETARNLMRNEIEDSFGDGREVTRYIRNNRS